MSDARGSTPSGRRAATGSSTVSSRTSATSRCGPTRRCGSGRGCCAPTPGRRTAPCVAIETWLRETGGFTYDESPPTPAGAPPLAHFVADGKRGYCQHFAGAMALMLRMLGVPARVAAGFTSGTYEDGGWTVTDHNAHAWVEAWFPGYGWLPFDPTPGRGSLAASYSASSTGVQRRRRGGRVRRRAHRAACTGGGLAQLRAARAEGAAGGASGGAAAAPATGAGARSGFSASWPSQLSAAIGVGQARAAAASLPDARSATAGRRSPARARRFPRRPGDRGRRQRDARTSCTSSCGLGARRRRPAIRGGAGRGALRAAREHRGSSGDGARGA